MIGSTYENEVESLVVDSDRFLVGFVFFSSSNMVRIVFPNIGR